jgi:hypothetical protein
MTQQIGRGYKRSAGTGHAFQQEAARQTAQSGWHGVIALRSRIPITIQYISPQV